MLIVFFSLPALFALFEVLVYLSALYEAVEVVVAVLVKIDVEFLRDVHVEPVFSYDDL